LERNRFLAPKTHGTTRSEERERDRILLHNWIAICIQEFTLGWRHAFAAVAVEADVDCALVAAAAGSRKLRMVKQVKCIDPELHSNSLGQADVLRERGVNRARRRPQAVADGSVANRAQFETVHGVALRVHPLESLKAGVLAGLSRYDVGELN